MPNTKQAKSALPYLQQVIEDEFVQEQLATAVSGARAAYVRVRKQRSQAVEDKRLYRNLRQAATALRNTAGALQPSKPPPKRRGRNAVVIATAILATVWLTSKLQKAQTQRSGSTPGSAASPAERPAAQQEPRAVPGPELAGHS
jgi:hypothetical protein